MRKKIVKGCIIFMLVGLSGCGRSGDVAAELAAEDVEVTEEITEDEAWEADMEEDEEPDMNEDTEEEAGNTEIKQSGTASSELSDDLFSFQMQVGEDIFTIPTTYQDFAEKGYVCDEPDREELEPGLCLVRQEFVKGDTVLFLNVVNLTGEDQPIENCSVVQIGVDSGYMRGEDYVDVFLPKGIQFEVSSKDDLLDAYGEPEELYEDSEEDGFTIIYYRKDFYQEAEFIIDNAKNIICSMQIENMPE